MSALFHVPDPNATIRRAFQIRFHDSKTMANERLKERRGRLKEEGRNSRSVVIVWHMVRFLNRPFKLRSHIPPQVKNVEYSCYQQFFEPHRK